MKRSLAAKAAVLATLLSGVFVSAGASASDITSGASQAAGDLNGNGVSVSGVLGIVTNTLIFFVGAISVIVLIIGGLRYITSGGNAASVQGAKNTIMYAIIGLVVSIAAYAIVQFVFTQFKIS